MKKFWKKDGTKPDHILEDGWQFYHRPTTLDPIGTVFRIDAENKRYIVDELNIPSTRGPEAVGRIERHAENGLGILAKLLNIGVKVNANANFGEKIEFELSKPQREVTKDVDVDVVLDPFLKSLKYRADNRYYLIRECRWASAMTYRLSKDRVLDLGGEAVINDALKVGAKFKMINESLYEIPHDFPEMMRVMFLPEEIKPVSAGLGGDEPELGRVPVNQQIMWED